MKAYTDYPFTELGDIAGLEAPIRECTVLLYDGDKYCDILIDGVVLEVKLGYLYHEFGRQGEVDSIKPFVFKEKL